MDQKSFIVILQLEVRDMFDRIQGVVLGHTADVRLKLTLHSSKN